MKVALLFTYALALGWLGCGLASYTTGESIREWLSHAYWMAGGMVSLFVTGWRPLP